MLPCAEMGALGGGPVSSTLSKEPAWGALGCSVEGHWRGGNEGRVPDWVRGSGAVLPARRLGVLLGGAGEPGEGGVVLPLAQGFWSC